MFVGSTELNELNAAIEEVNKKLEVLKNQLTGALAIPSVGDPVYKVAEEVFSIESPFNLTRSKAEYARILRQARRRFLVGCPPRKGNDTSMGDAINWEWIVDCAINSRRRIVIVSRDSDYGLSFDKVAHLNESLWQEFKERVGDKAEIELVDSLADALKKANISVTPEERKAEEKLITAATRSLASGLDEKFWDTVRAAWPKNLSFVTGDLLMGVPSPIPSTIPLPPAPIAPVPKPQKATRKTKSEPGKKKQT